MPLSPNVWSFRASLFLTFHTFFVSEAILSGVVIPRVLSSLAFGATNPLPSFNQSPDTPSNPPKSAKVEGGKSRQAKLKLTSSVVSNPVAEQVQKGPEYCPGLIVCRTIDN